MYFDPRSQVFSLGAITLAGVELAHRIRKGQHLLPLEHDGRASSLKELWDRALSQAGMPATKARGRSPSMRHISAADSRSDLNARTTRLGDVRYPRKISFGRNLYLLVMPKGGRSWRYCYRYVGSGRRLLSARTRTYRWFARDRGTRRLGSCSRQVWPLRSGERSLSVTATVPCET
jgi:hypothetical protein